MANSIVPNLAALYGQASSVAANEFALKQAMEARQRQQAMEDAIRASYVAPNPGSPGYFESPTGRTVPAVPGTPGGIDETGLVARLSQVAPVEALKLQGQIRSQGASHVQAGLMMTRYAGALAKDVSDQTSYDQYKQRLKDVGFPDTTIAALPQAYSPDTIKQLVDAGNNVTEADIAKTLAEKQAGFNMDVALAGVKGKISRDTALAVESARAGHAKDLETQKEGAKTKAGGAEVKAADSNSIRAAVATLFGATYDPLTGQISGIAKDQSTRALSIAARAQEIFQSDKAAGRATSHDQAAKRAATEAGYNFPGAVPSGGVPSFNYVPGKGLVPTTPGI